MPKKQSTGDEPDQDQPKPVDDAAALEHDAVKAEAEDKPLTIEYDGQTYTLFTAAGGDVELMEDAARLGDGDLSVMPRIVARFLGPAQYAAFKARYRNPETQVVPMDNLRELFNRFDTALGE